MVRKVGAAVLAEISQQHRGEIKIGQGKKHRSENYPSPSDILSIMFYVPTQNDGPGCRNHDAQGIAGWVDMLLIACSGARASKNRGKLAQEGEVLQHFEQAIHGYCRQWLRFACGLVAEQLVALPQCACSLQLKRRSPSTLLHLRRSGADSTRAQGTAPKDRTDGGNI